jgi:hypothetical protein
MASRVAAGREEKRTGFTLGYGRTAGLTDSALDLSLTPTKLRSSQINSFPKIPALFCVSATDPDTPNTCQAYRLGILTSQNVFRNEEE